MFPKNVRFDSPEEQEVVVREWCQERAKVNLDTMDLKFRWYPAKYVVSVGSIFPTGDCTKSIVDSDPKDVLILEEPEHLCWFHYGQRWPDIFRHVIGIVHTNYSDYMNIVNSSSSSWVVVKEISYIGETILTSTYTHYVNLIQVTMLGEPYQVFYMYIPIVVA